MNPHPTSKNLTAGQSLPPPHPSSRATIARSPGDLCRSVISPIRLLPHEILLEIFALHHAEVEAQHESVISGYGRTMEQELEAETRRLAKADLLQLSQVCSRWHTLIIGTPLLWSSFDLNIDWWDGSPDLRLAFLLRSVLERGRETPLEVTARTTAAFSENREALGLLAEHSRRWRKASFIVPCEYLEDIASAQGNVPHLEILGLNWTGFQDNDMASEVTSFFTVAPLLKEVRFSGPAAALSHLPLEQLLRLFYFDVQEEDLDDLFPLIARLTRTRNELHLRLDLWKWRQRPYLLSTTVPEVAPGVWSLVLDVTGECDPEHTKDVLSHIMAHFTLPALFSVQFQSFGYLGIPLPWPHVAFGSLSHRSSFTSHLIRLDLCQVYITEVELIQTLSGLRLLEQLSLWDHRKINGEDTNLVIVSDSLLQRLTWTDEPTCLVPSLGYLYCQTLFQFDDIVFRDFVLSRITPGRNAPGPFRVQFGWYPRQLRALDPAVVAQLEELQSQGEFSFSIGLGDSIDPYEFD